MKEPEGFWLFPYVMLLGAIKTVKILLIISVIVALCAVPGTVLRYYFPSLDADVAYFLITPGMFVLLVVVFAAGVDALEQKRFNDKLKQMDDRYAEMREDK